MLPSFCKAVNMVNSNEDVQKYYQLMDIFIGELKAKYNITNQNPNHTYISSNVKSETATKNHGCNGYKRRKSNNCNNFFLYFCTHLSFQFSNSFYQYTHLFMSHYVFCSRKQLILLMCLIL